MTKVVLDRQNELVPDAADVTAIAHDQRYATFNEAERYRWAKVHKAVRLIVSACDRRQSLVVVPAKGWPNAR